MLLKKLTGILLAAALIFSASACSASGGTAGSSGTEETEISSAGEASAGEASSQPSDGAKTEIRMAWWGGDSRHEKYNQILDLYESENPNVKIMREYGGNYWEKLATMVAGGNPPDVIHMWNPYFMRYASSGTLEDLTPYFEDGVIKSDGWTMSIQDTGVYEGKTLLAIIGVNAAGLAYNETMIREAGMEPPKSGMTWDEYTEYCRELKTKLPEGVYPSYDCTIYGPYTEFTFSYLRSYEPDIVTPDGKQLAVDSSVLKDYLSYWEMMRDEGLSPNAQIMAEQAGKIWEEHMFTAGKVATFFTNSNQLEYYQRIMQDKVAWVRAPVIPDAPYPKSEFFMSVGLGISKTSQVKDEAAKLIDWFCNTKEVQLIYNMEFGTPANSNVLKWLEEEGKLTEAVEVPSKYMEEISQDTPPTTMTNSTLQSVFDAEWLACQQEVGFKTKTIDQAVDEFVAIANDRLANES